MIVDARTVPAGHSVLTQTTGLDGQKDDLPALKDTVSCRAEIDRSGSILYIHLRFQAVVELECSRCLKPMLWPVSGDLRITAMEQAGRHGPAFDDETVDYYYDSRHPEIDLGVAMYEEIMTTLPLKPLCNDACRGIEIRSVKTAGTEVDPRWEALKKLKVGKK